MRYLRIWGHQTKLPVWAVIALGLVDHIVRQLV